MKIKLFGLLFVYSMAVANSQIEINTNNTALEVTVNKYLEYVNDDTNYYLTFNYLSNEKKTGVKNKIVSLGFTMINPLIDDNGLGFGLGIKVLTTDDTRNETFITVPLSMLVRYEYDDLISFDSEVNYAPAALSFSDAKSYNSVKLKANYKILENGYIFTGYRNIRISYNNISTVKYDDSLFFGFKVGF